MIAALSSWHEEHDAAGRALADVLAVPAHVVVEAYSVLTRLPGGLAVPPGAAADAVTRRFGGQPFRLPEPDREQLVTKLADAGVLGGASYDGLVALEAASHGETLLTLDRRAQETYRRLGVSFRAIGSLR